MATGAYNPYGTTYAQRQRMAQATYPNQTPAMPKLQNSPNPYGTQYSTSSNFTPGTYDFTRAGNMPTWGNATQANSWKYADFANSQSVYLNKLNAQSQKAANDYAQWMNNVNSASNYGNLANEMSYYLNPQREYQQMLSYENYLNSLAQNQTNSAARGLGYTGLSAGLDQRSQQTYNQALLQIEAELNKQAMEQALSSINNQNTTGTNWLNALMKQYSESMGAMNSLGALFGEGAGQASDYEKNQLQLALEREKLAQDLMIEREKMANALAVANLNSGSRGGGSGYSGGGYSGGGYYGGGGSSAGTLAPITPAPKIVGKATVTGPGNSNPPPPGYSSWANYKAGIKK